MPYLVRAIQYSDWDSISKIYLQGINTNLATFQTECPQYSDWEAAHHKHSRLVIVMDDNIIGWAALAPVSGRCVYSGVAEVSIYVDEAQRGKGIATILMKALIDSAEKNGIWTLQSAILQDNEASIRLHEKCGFRMVGYREKIGLDRYGNWRNIVLMEYRSKTVPAGY